MADTSLDTARQPRAAVPPGQLVYAVGDIHGRADLLAEMLRQIAEDAAPLDAERRSLIFLGDYIDRGPDSRGVIDLALEGLPEGFEAVYLKGNHEELLLDFLQGGVGLPLWMVNGADATLASYGVDLSQLLGQTEDAWHAAFLAALPDAHRRFYESLGLMVSFGDYLFVHAGVRPGVPLDRQDPHDVIWIRDEFLSSEEDFGKVVVHGHTPGAVPVIRPNRIGIDTQAWMSGRLTALRLFGDERLFLSTL